MRIFATKKRQLGAATAMDMMLTFPLFATTLLFMIQMALVLHAYTVINYSAYKAARSARVHVLDGDHAFLGLDFEAMGMPSWADEVIGIPNAAIIMDGLIGGGGSTSDFFQDDVTKRLTAAAMNQLITISPASQNYLDGRIATGDSYDEVSVRDFVTAATEIYGDQDRIGPLMRKAQYAYSDLNTIVKFKFLDFNNPVLQEIEDVWRIFDTVTNTPMHSQINVPVSVTVRYRYELQIPIGQVFFANDPDDPYGRWMEATVKLM